MSRPAGDAPFGADRWKGGRMLVCRLTGKEALSSPTFLPSSSSSWGGLELLRGPWCQDSAPHLRERGWLSRISQQDGSWQPPQASQPWTALRPSQESLPPPQAPECQNSVDFDSTCYPKVSTAQEGGVLPSPLPCPLSHSAVSRRV